MGIRGELLLFEQFNRAVNPKLVDHLGVEREAFLVNRFHDYEPRSDEFVARYNDPSVVPELSACQVEFVSSPHSCLGRLEEELVLRAKRAKTIARGMGLDIAYSSVGPSDMPILISKSNPRYPKIAKELGPERLRAACRIAGIHFHYGVRNDQHAISVYKKFLEHIDELIQMTDRSQGKRLELYRVVVGGDYMPRAYESVSDFQGWAEEQGIVKLKQLRNNWCLVRITPYGTVEVRVCDNTASEKTVISWAKRVREIARQAP